MDYHIDWGGTYGTILVCKLNSPCNDAYWPVPRKNDWTVKGGNPKGGWGDKGWKGAPQGRGRE